jgi:hypothetical protein
MPYITFVKKHTARTGNIIFQYLFCKALSLNFGHTYIPIEEYKSDSSLFLDPIYIYDSNSNEYYNTDFINVEGRDIICDGFFQQSHFYVNIREKLLTFPNSVEDYWYGVDGNKEYLSDFINHPSPVVLDENDLVISLRLDDFIQLPRETSDIIPPEHYINIIDNWIQHYGKFNKLYIVMDKFKHDWEHRYVEYFGKWNPILLQNSLKDDIAVMRDSYTLLHSNSSLCWISSFISKSSKMRFIPNTHFYGGQNLDKIDETDIMIDVSPLTHHAVYNLHVHNYVKSQIYPLAYCIPDEYIVDDNTAMLNKHIIISDLIPGQLETYRFGKGEEDDYKKMYRESLFAYTRKKGGWDCLRHYEIMANGCIPIFKELDKCPPETLISFPKELIINANKTLLPWKSHNMNKYNEYVKNMLDFVRKNCSATATAKYFLSKLKNTNPNKVLLIMGNCGINYSRETLWIGLHNIITSNGGVAVEYPSMDFMYNDYSGNKGDLYGNGFTYAGILTRTNIMSNKEIEEKTREGYWDLVIYGKVGPDEGWEGSFPNMPLWNDVVKRYGSHQLVFLYGGDECIDLTRENRYKQHILNHGQLGTCFVRELCR